MHEAYSRWLECLRMRAHLGFDTTLHIRVEPELRDALADVARRERTTASEVVRRSLRAILAASGDAGHNGRDRPCQAVAL